MGRRRARLDAGALAVEGPTLVAEALAAGLDVHDVFLGEELAPEAADRLRAAAAARSVPVHVLAAGVAGRIADTVTPQPAFAVARRPHAQLDQVASIAGRDGRFVLVLVDVADPGNAGTLVRTAEAAGAAAVVCTGAVADPFGPKAVRAAAGAAFRLPVVEVPDALEALDGLGAAGCRPVAAVATGGHAHDRVDLTGAVALVLGGEAHGLPPAVVAAAAELVTIPMPGPTESLNVAAAGAVLCFEAARQRRSGVGVVPENRLDGPTVKGQG